MIPQKRFDHCRRLIAASQPDDFGWRAMQACHFDEVGVERGKNESIYPRVIPERAIIDMLKPEQAHMARFGK